MIMLRTALPGLIVVTLLLVLGSLVMLGGLRMGCADGLMIGPGTSDFCAELCGGYHIHRMSGVQIWVGEENSDGQTPPVIPPTVKTLGHDGRFIVAQQHPLKRRSPGDPNDTYMEPDVNKFNYWILDTRTSEVHGPFALEAWREKRKELGVSEAIELKAVRSYRQPDTRPAP